MNIADFYTSSWFANLAYVDWRDSSFGTNAIPQDAIEDANAAERVPGQTDGPSDGTIDTLGEKIFNPVSRGGLGWQVAAFHANGETDSGFAGSLFVKAGTNEKVLAVRGTEPDLLTPVLDDLVLADLRDIVGLGVAVEQGVAMVNWINRLRAPEGATVVQLALPSDVALAAVIASLPPQVAGITLAALIAGLARTPVAGAGLGQLTAADRLTVTGHSLGGHLGLMAARLFPDLVDQTVTFNAPGFDASPGHGLSEIFFSALSATGVVPGAAPSFDGLSLTNLQGESSGPEVFAGDADLIGDLGTLPGGEQLVQIEVSTHSMDELLTSLGVHALLNRLLGAGGNLAVTNALVQAASREERDTDEQLVDRLTDLLLPDKHYEALKVGAGSYYVNGPPFDTRGPLHERLLALEENLDAHPGGRLESLVGDGTVGDPVLDAATVAGRAMADTPEGLAYRYALTQLNPFAVSGFDYAPRDQNHELDLYDESTGTGLTNDYLADRAHVLAQVVSRNVADSVLVTNGEFSNEFYADSALGLSAATADVAVFGPEPPQSAKQYVFGGAGVDILMGGTQDDRLYGGDGHDFLVGGAGADELIGGPGSDVLYGGGDDDLLIGDDPLRPSAGAADALFGEGGDDRLFGEQGRHRSPTGRGRYRHPVRRGGR